MSKVEAVILNTKPFRPTDYNEKAIQVVLDESYLTCDVKKDGVRLNLCVEPRFPVAPTMVEWLSREGKRFPNFTKFGQPLSGDERWAKFYNPNLGEGMFADTGFMLDAELVLLDPLGTEFPCKMTSGSLRREANELPLSRLRVYVFDIIPMDVVLSGGEYEVFQCVRKVHVEYQVSKLKEIFPEIDWIVAETFDVYSIETLPVIEREGFDEEGNEITVKLQPPLSLDQLYTSVRERGEEGLVIKDPMGYYRRSKCNGWWKKVPQDNEDGKVVGLVWGSKGKANEGKVIGFEVELESGHVVNACKISKADMDTYTARVEAEGPTCFNGYTARVTCMERYPDGSMRHPSFDEFRGISSPFDKE
ncbi:putative ATP-dependent DNA ligase [Pseudomonas phage 10P302A]|uniref:DNA ligase n=1 Tax=Pseudomonas phage 10P302A TaxID=3038233 RepID=A0AAF0GKL0_9CAUD|nr:putative ATP-dependent DNA ligase [Pseudomonas phage 10P302A]